jgi:hypothetical protein
MQTRAIGKKSDGTLKVLERLIVTPEPFEGNPTIVVGVDVVGASG